MLYNPGMEYEKRQLNIRLSANTYKLFAGLAEKLDMSMSELVRQEIRHLIWSDIQSARKGLEATTEAHGAREEGRDNG